MIIETAVPPIPQLVDAALAVAPFPLPKDAAVVSHFWTFKTSGGGMPTLPTAVFTAYVLRKIPALGRIPSPASLAAKSQGADNVALTETIMALRHLFLESPGPAQAYLNHAQAAGAIAQNPRLARLFSSFAKLYGGADSRLLNFYGPPLTIPTISYHELIGAGAPQIFPRGLDLRGKIALVGLTGQSQLTTRDGFYTAFHQDGDSEMNGVEIAATAIANLIEDRSIALFPQAVNLLIVLAWGTLIGVLCWVLPFGIGLSSIVLLGCGYLAFALYGFSARGFLIPVAIPLFIQLPAGALASVIDKLIRTIKERKKIRKVFECYVPQGVVDQLMAETTDPGAYNRVVHGCCLITDVAGFTPLSEQLAPQDLSNLMNEYLKVLFASVHRHQGIISDVVGDSAMAVWVDATNQPISRRRAVCAALEISNALDTSRFLSQAIAMPTRIGLHAGELFLGTVGAEERYAFRAMGDIVNTAARIESLNKQLGTRLLATEQVVTGLDGFVFRDVGRFILVGKSQPIRIYEVMGIDEIGASRQKELCEAFQCALNACRAGRWDDALELLEHCTRIHEADGPTRFYRDLCSQYQNRRQPPQWDGQINLASK